MNLIEVTDACTGEKKIIDDDERLTIDNVVRKLEEYIKSITKDIPKGEKYPINREILMTFSFFMEFALHRANLDIIKKLHEQTTFYFVDC